jgi:hypothetical protein
MDSWLAEIMSLDMETVKEGENTYKIRVYGRGLHLIFKENEKGLICDIDAEHGVIYQKSIKIWDTTNEKINELQKSRILELIVKYYKQFYDPNVIVSDSLKY